jgi:hypothetical protein
MKYFLAAVIATLSLVLVLGTNDAQEKKAKHTIPEVMKQAHKSGLWKKVATGKASDAEKEQLVELYTSLSQNEPPKGEHKAWKERTEAMLAAAKLSAKGDDKGGKALLSLVNCGMCHKMFRTD